MRVEIYLQQQMNFWKCSTFFLYIYQYS